MIPNPNKDKIISDLEYEISALKEEFFRKCKEHLEEYKRVETLMSELNRLRDRFEAVYAHRSGVTVEFLREHGQHVEPCDCEDPICLGWQMAGPGIEEKNHES